MKQKLFFAFMAFAAMTFVACNKEKGNNPDDPNEGQQSKSISCSRDTIESTLLGGSFSVTITSSGNWSATSDAQWIEVTPNSGVGDAFVTIKVADGNEAIGHVLFSNSSESVSLTVVRQGRGGKNGEEQGHKYVDMGLSVKWATMNVGANKEEDYGGYYAWAETTTKTSTYYWESYKYCDSQANTLLRYVTNSAWGYNNFQDNKTKLDTSDDAAYVNWGGNWRMPTIAEWEELGSAQNSTWTWTSVNNISGLRITSKITGESIFLPAAGQKTYSTDNSTKGTAGNYWSSELGDRYPYEALYAHFDTSAEYYQNIFSADNYNYRCYGLSVRPVCP